MQHFHVGEKHPNGDDKVTRYGWEMTNQPGELRYVNKNQLNVDHEYQREAKHKSKIMTIARNFNWISLAVLVVARRENGELWVVDGQHRLIAAKQRADIQLLPCAIHDVYDIQKEATAFLETNSGRKAIKASEKHKAALMCGDPVAEKVQELFDTGGKHIVTGNVANGIKCISSMNKLVSNNLEDLEAVWPLICELTKDDYCGERLIEGLVYIEKRMPKGQSLSDKKWSERLLKIGHSELTRAASEGAAFFSKGGAKPWALGMVNRINKNLRYKLDISND